MKKILLVLGVLLLTFTLVGCTSEGIEPYVITETEIVEIEIPTIIVETEIVEVPIIIIEKEIVEIPVITTEIYEVEVEVPIYIEITDVRTTFYQTGYSDEIIFVISKGHEAYVLEFRYTDTLTTPPTMHFSQMAYQYDGVDILWLFLEEMENYEGVEVVDYDDFVEEVHDFVDYVTWEETEEGFNILYDAYYSIELEHENVITIGEDNTGTLNLTDNYTDVLLLKFTEETTVTITVTTNEMIDINLYYTSFINYEFDYFLTFPEGTSSQIYTFEAGSHYLELENYYDFDSVDYTITITVNE